MTSVLRLDDVSLHRGTTRILTHVNWSVEEGEHWVLLGPNGAGKTTVSRIAAARLFPSSGTADILGERMGRVDVSELHPRIGLCSSALAGRVPEGELVISVVLSASYGRIGVWREEYDDFDVERARALLDALGAGELAEHDMAQVQQQLMVSGAEKCWFVVSDGTPDNMAIADVFPDADWFTRIKEGWAQFARDLEASADEVPQILAKEYRDLDAQIKALQSQQQAVKDQLIALAEEADSDSLAVGGITLKRIESKGAVDYKAIPALKDIDLDVYRKPASITWRININKE